MLLSWALSCLALSARTPSCPLSRGPRQSCAFSRYAMRPELFHRLEYARGGAWFMFQLIKRQTAQNYRVLGCWKTCGLFLWFPAKSCRPHVF